MPAPSGDHTRHDGKQYFTSDVVFDGTVTLTSAGAPVGATSAIAKTDEAVATVLAAATFARIVQIHVRVDEVFADGDGAQTAVTIGETGAATKFAAAAKFAGAAAGSVQVFAGTLSANKALIVTPTAATGTGTGGVTVTVVAVPAAA